jgi:hypothetical protein
VSARGTSLNWAGRLLAATALLGALSASPAQAAPVSVDLSGNCTSNCGLDGSDGNARVFTFLDGLGLSSRVRVTAWSASQNQSTGALSNWRTAFVGEYDGGLGVTNRDEGNGSSNNSHITDNLSGIDFLVFHFDGEVIATGADLNAFAMTASGYSGSGSDTDASFYIGTTTVPFGTSISMSTAAQRLSVMTHYIDTTGGSSSNYRNFNTTTQYRGNTLVIAASVGDYMRSGSNRPDGFKVENIRVEYPIPVPAPAALGLFGIGALALGIRRRRR